MTKVKRSYSLIGLRAYVHETTKLNRKFDSSFSDLVPEMEGMTQRMNKYSHRPHIYKHYANEYDSDMTTNSAPYLLPGVKQHPQNIILSKGEKLSFEKRYPRYHRVKSGGVWCNNKMELKSQEGVVLQLIKDAGNQLFKGRGIVGIPLPVRVFEPRSMIDRLTDWWSTGPIFLPVAARCSSDAVERLKYVMCFAVSGLYGSLHQRKPFNPILGETYQGIWPDGSSVLLEHTSHHPPISNFLIISKEFKLWGHWEFTAKVTDLGNGALGTQKGSVNVQFLDGTIIKYIQPSVKLYGILFGKRMLHWIGGMTFTDERNEIVGEIKLGPKKQPSDIIEGTITHKGEEVCSVNGSWLEKLDFNQKTYIYIYIYIICIYVDIGN